LAPFLSILKTEAPWKRFRNVVVVHAVRYARELTYRELIGSTPARYVSFVSRESAPGSLAGRIPAAIADGRLEASAGLPLKPENSHVMLCGNPQMLKDAAAALMARGMRKHRRRTSGHITVESFW
jgi:ferredoxin--NADP+ reductase